MKLLLLTDTVMNKDAGGISQTLYNLLSFLEPQDILCITAGAELKKLPATEPYTDRYITYNFEIFHIKGNRFSKYINPFLKWFNYSFNQQFRSFGKIKKQIEIFNPDVVISCPNGPVGVFMHNKLLGKNVSINVVPYFMDDWMYKQKFSWLGGEIHQNIKKLLANNARWLMISEDLSKILEERYEIVPKALLEVHNPVDLSNAPDVQPLIQKQEYTMAYAGALWPMHYDSFKVIAKSVYQLKDKLTINLVLYTSESFWNWRKLELEPLGVSYGGSIPYREIHNKLSQADALLVVSSFLDDYYSHSKGSLQTKITDYLKAKRLIISCGPNYSANHNFLKKHNCGICIESNDSDIVSSQLSSILNNIQDYQVMTLNGWELLENEFTFLKVHQKLKNFIFSSLT